MKFYLQLPKDLLYIMRITLSQLIVLFVLSGVSYASSGKAQGILNNTVSIDLTSSSLRTVFAEIEKSANVKFVYSRNVINTDQEVTVKADETKLSSLLDELLLDRGIKYEVINDQIVLSRVRSSRVKKDMDENLVVDFADIVVTGRVTDSKGEGLPGVSVKVKGTNVGTATNAAGNYTLRLPSAYERGTLVIAYLGFVTQELPVAGRTRIDVQLKEDVKALEEVVVVGYNIVKKSDVTGAVASIKAEDIRSRPVQNALQAMQGKTAGVDITSNERPGELGSIYIRGVRSITASNSPLYVVDGIPLAAGGIEAINPNDIEAIDVLKDASATAIYGSRGANGVVLVTTKKGKTGSFALNYVGTTTVEKMYDRTDMMNSAQYVEFRRAAYRRTNTATKIAYPDVATRAADSNIFSMDPYAWRNIVKGWQNGTWNGDLVPTTDWTGMVLNTGITQDHLLSASGGTEKLKGYGSFGYLNQGGTQKGQDYERYNGKFSVDASPVKWFSMGGSLNATYGVQNYGYATTNATGPGNIYFAAQGMLPYAVPYDDNGNRINLPGGDINIQNPIDEDKYCINLRKVLRTLGNVYGEINIMPGLKYRINFGPDFYHNYNGRWMDARSVNRGAGESGSSNYAQLNQTSRFSWTLDNLIYYNTTLSGKHNLGLTLLQSASSNRIETSSMTATALPWDSQKWYQLNSVSKLDAYSTGLEETSLSSYMGRFNYDYKGKYLLTASARWDGASQLAEGHKWDFFPSAAVAWRIDQENFMKGTPWIDLLKLRLGYGSTGNAAVRAYSTKGGVSTLYYTWGSTVDAGYVSSDPSLSSDDVISMPNVDLGWEHTSQWNVGVDFDFLNGRINGAIDLYHSKTTDLLMDKSILSVTGYVKTLANVAATSNKGIDISLNTVNIKKRDFNWATTLNFSANRDKIVELADGRKDDLNNNWIIGERLNIFYDYQKIGIWQNTESDLAEMEKFNTKAGKTVFSPGNIKVADLNGDYVIEPNNDRVIRGHRYPDWTAGLTNTFNYKNWDLSFFLYARWGFTIESGAESMQGRFAQRLIDYWTPQNPTNEYPSPNYNSASGDTYKSSMNYQDGSFVKFRNISLGYNFSKATCRKLHISNLKAYAQVTNPGLLYSKVDWIDPDLGGSTFNRGFVFGLNVGF